MTIPIIGKPWEFTTPKTNTNIVLENRPSEKETSNSYCNHSLSEAMLVSGRACCTVKLWWGFPPKSNICQLVSLHSLICLLNKFQIIWLTSSGKAWGHIIGLMPQVVVFEPVENIVTIVEKHTITYPHWHQFTNTNTLKEWPFNSKIQTFPYFPRWLASYGCVVLWSVVFVRRWSTDTRRANTILHTPVQVELETACNQHCELPHGFSGGVADD